VTEAANIEYALTNQASGVAQTYVAATGELVVGYYSLASGEMAHEAAPIRVTKGMARHPIPVMWLARLATDLTWQGKGVGAALLADASTPMAIITAPPPW
jgi:hypothetical protein